MNTIKDECFPLVLYSYHNLRLRTNLEGPKWEECQVVLKMLLSSNLNYALTAHITVHPEILQIFWKNATLSEYENREQMAIKSEVLNQKILVNEASIKTALQLDDNNDVLTFTRAQKDDVLRQMGYHTQTQQRAINKHGFIKPWQYLVT
ncbi:hypothetical protein Hanom_Chr13g01191231 [Helianthus anomalus]